MKKSQIAKRWIGATLCAGLGGCAAPITSTFIESSEATSKGYEGIRYHLSKSTLNLTFGARLTKCDTTATIELLPVKKTVTESADQAASYVVNPKGAWNLFRQVDLASLKLTDDGRLANVEAQVTDKTFEQVGELVKLARLVAQPASMRAHIERDGSAEERQVTPKPSVCLGDANDPTSPIGALKQKSELEAVIKTRLRQRNALFQSGATTPRATDMVALLAMFDVDIAALNVKLEAVNEALTKNVTLRLESAGAAIGAIDIVAGWTVSAKDEQCAKWLSPTSADDSSVAKKFAKEIKDVAQGLRALGASVPKHRCVLFAAKLGTESEPTKSAAAISEYDGLLYRVPSHVTWSAAAQGDLPTDASISVQTRDPLWTIDGQRFTYSDDGKEAMSQFGAIARMPSDIGRLVSNSVKADFGKNGLPSSATWSGSPVSLAQLLGLAKAVLPAMPPSDPLAIPKSDILIGLMQSCLDAIAAKSSIPSYCTGLTK